MKFKESALAHQFLDGLEGIEIGGSARNGVGLHAHVRGSEMLTAISNAEAAHPNKLIAQAGNVP